MRRAVIPVMMGAAVLGSCAPAHAAPGPNDAPVCHAVVDQPHVPGDTIVTAPGVDCHQQADQLRFEVTLQFQPSENHPWFSADHHVQSGTLPLRQYVPLAAKCEPGFWRNMVEVWETTAGHQWHRVYLSPERTVQLHECRNPDIFIG